MSTNTNSDSDSLEETPFVRASDLIDGRGVAQPTVDANHTTVEYSDGTSALTIYDADACDLAEWR